jgi:hypothetical protein
LFGIGPSESTLLPLFILSVYKIVQDLTLSCGHSFESDIFKYVSPGFLQTGPRTQSKGNFMTLPVIGITMGDPTGIGPEIISLNGGGVPSLPADRLW